MKLFASVFLLLLPMLSVAGSIQVRDARSLELPDGSQVVFRLSAPAEHASFTLDNPPRLVLDLSNARLHSAQVGRNLQTADVRGVRTGVKRGVHLRIVLDLNGLMRYRTSIVRAVHGEGYHLVVDLFRTGRPTTLPTLVSLSEAHAPPVAPPPTPELRAVDRVPPRPKPMRRELVIALDPGHGGKDPGAIGASGTREKDVVLQVARRLKSLIDAEPGMRAILTRYSDEYLHLRERIAIARRHNADMFVSIHADAFTDPKAHGSSVFILSPKGASSEAARWLAERENAADLIGGVSLRGREYDVAEVLLDLSQDATLEASLFLADQVLGELGGIGDVHKSRVERAGFAVLKSPDIPSILVETAFITNPAEERRLRSHKHQQRLARAILNGIRAYYRARPPLQPVLVEASFESDRMHVIRPGESLSDIAQDYRISLSELRAVNNLEPGQLRMPAGTFLTIPAGGS